MRRLRLKDLPLSEVFQDNIVFIQPDEKIDFRALFNDRPLKVELCCGNGHFLADLAEMQPEFAFIGVDRLYRRIAAASRKVRKRKLENVRLVLDDATRFLNMHIEPCSLKACYILFPDPWPKRRHHKHRLITDGFLQQVSERLMTGGELVIAHDHDEYSEWIAERIQRTASLEPRYPELPCSFDIQEDLPRTLYEQKWRSLGRTIRYFRYAKKD
ncbi:MAG: tRNA (guanosine(46)-N7)-methyltransferase TrmB [Deltaproteobacteria bacterium]|nr:tRNA (guanosine(46)-N7)-methyltransferase TrmB [Deltaproteobacteria bacterium]